MVQSWFADTTIECNPGEIILRCGSKMKRERIESHYMDHLARAFGVSKDSIPSNRNGFSLTATPCPLASPETE